MDSIGMISLQTAQAHAAAGVGGQARPSEGWHQAPAGASGGSGACYYVTHVGEQTHIEIFDRARVTSDTAARLAELSQSKALGALRPPKNP